LDAAPPCESRDFNDANVMLAFAWARSAHRTVEAAGQ